MKPLALILLAGLLSCQRDPTSTLQPEAFVQSDSITGVSHTEETPEYLIDSLTIAGKMYTVVQGHPSGENELPLSILYKRDTIYRHGQMATNGFEFTDFDSNGVQDIMLNQISNVGGIRELIMFDPKTLNFREIKGFDNFPSAKKIKDTQYYFSYHRSGCADYNWGSELFIIRNFEAIAIGEIEGIGCENEERNGIFIYRLKGEERTEIKAIKRNPGYYGDKLDFITDYWSKHYKKFE